CVGGDHTHEESRKEVELESKKDFEEGKPEYDLEKVYDKQIAPLMTKIIAICKKHKLPMVASFQCADWPW
ncbi:MAG: hypothetical protein L0Y56_02920, partial [Nitrospira sp.]|nr:hypothetical protein [Nitrospira sp.]